LPSFRLGTERCTWLVILGRGAGRPANPCRIWQKGEKVVSASAPKLGAMHTPDCRGEDSAPDASPGTQSRETGEQDETRETSRREEPLNFTLKSLHWLKMNERIEYKILSLTFKLLYTAQPPQLYNLISLEPPRNTRSSSVVTLAHPPTHSSLKITSRSFRYESPISGINCLTHFVNHVLICLFLIHFHDHLTSSGSPSPVHHSSFITSSFFHSNLKTSFSQILSFIDISHPIGQTPRLFRPTYGFYFFSRFSFL